jgi:hypothetical protein
VRSDGATGAWSAMISSCWAFARTSSAVLPRKPATSLADMPRRSASSKKSKSAFAHTFAHSGSKIPESSLENSSGFNRNRERWTDTNPHNE